MPFGAKRKVKPNQSKEWKKQEKGKEGRQKYKLAFLNTYLHKKTADIISCFFIALLFFIIVNTLLTILLLS